MEFKRDVDKIMEWVHGGPTLHVVTVGGIPIHVHVSLLFLTSLIIITGYTNFSYTFITLGIGWTTSLLTSLNHYNVTKAVGGVIEKNVLWAPGGISPCSYKGVPDQLKLLAAIAGPILLFPFFIIYFLLAGGQIEFALGLIAPNGDVTNFHAVTLWANSLMLWLMAINFLYPLHPLTGFELLRHSVGRLVGKTALVILAVLIAIPMTALFIWQGAIYFNLLQIWIAVWGLPQIVQIILAVATNTVDQLPFFAGEEKPVDDERATPAASGYGKLDEGKWEASQGVSQVVPPAPTAPAKVIQMKVNAGMKLPPGTYTIEDASA